MKRYLLMFLLMFTMSFMPSQTVSAQTYTYRTTAFAMKQLNAYGRWTDWSDWQSSDMLMTIDFTNDIVKIYSPTIQVYRVIEYVRNYRDNSGGMQAEFRFIDQDYDKGTMRLRVEPNGTSQVYIDFANLMWVYNIVKTD